MMRLEIQRKLKTSITCGSSTGSLLGDFGSYFSKYVKINENVPFEVARSTRCYAWMDATINL